MEHAARSDFTGLQINMAKFKNPGHEGGRNDMNCGVARQPVPPVSNIQFSWRKRRTSGNPKIPASFKPDPQKNLQAKGVRQDTDVDLDPDCFRSMSLATEQGGSDSGIMSTSDREEQSAECVSHQWYRDVPITSAHYMFRW